MGIIFTGSRHSIRPSLNLDFANSKALDPRITFTRASNATYYDGYTSVKAEENLLKYSETFTDSDWQKTSVSVSENQTAPNGQANEASTVTSTATSNTSIAKNNLIYTSGKKYTASFYFKYSDYQYLFIDFPNAHFNGNDNVIIDIQNGTITKAGDEGSSITDVGNGWYRVTLTATANSSGTSFVSFGTNLNSSSLSPGIDIVGREFYVWGGQLEERDTATAYTPTTDSPITKYQPALQTAGNNVARFDHNPTTGESLGLLIEEQRTNLSARSEEFDNVYWSKINYTAKANQTIAPDGTLSADLLILDDGVSAGGSKYIARGTFTTSGTSAFSIYIKNFGCTGTFTLQDGSGNGVVFNLENNTKTNFGSFISSPVAEDVGNGWYRLKFATSTTTNSFFMYQSGFTGNGHNGIFLWGAQFEEASFPTSYIKTTNSQVTRSADDCEMLNIDQDDWLKQGVGTLYGEFSKPYVGQTNGVTSYASAFALANDQFDSDAIRVFVEQSTSPKIISNLFLNASTEAGFTLISPAVADTYYKTAIAYERNNVDSSGNGSNETTDTSAEIPFINRLRIFKRVGFQVNGNYGTIKKLSYYPIKLTKNEVIDLTEE